jgi:hypothetical protein
MGTEWHYKVIGRFKVQDSLHSVKRSLDFTLRILSETLNWEHWIGPKIKELLFETKNRDVHCPVDFARRRKLD